MRVLFVIRDPPGFGGAERRLLEIGRRLVARGHEVHVLCGKTGPGLPDEQVLAGMLFNYIRLLPEIMFRFETLSFYLSRYLFYFLSAFWGARVRRIRPDIIVDYVTPSPSLVYLLARRMGIPCAGEIMEYRGFREWREAVDPVSGILGFLSQNLFFRILSYRRIITISEATRRQLEHGGIRAERIEVIPMAISPEDYRAPAGLRRAPARLVIVGRLMLQKGHRFLLDALPAVAVEVPDVRLIVVGDGPLLEPLSMQARRLGIADRVHFTGLVSEEDKIRILWESQLFVMPSVQEGFGLVVLEALACGLPVLAFDLPVFREILSPECGVRIPKGDQEALSREIVRLLKDPRRIREISEHNHTYVGRFDWESVVDSYEALLLALCKDAI